MAASGVMLSRLAGQSSTSVPAQARIGSGESERGHYMTLNRRQALLAVLTMPMGSMQITEQQNEGIVKMVSQATRFIVTLADEPEAEKNGGVWELEVRYKGAAQKFSAAMIWWALTNEDGAQLTKP
jgi:hypothetical protein